MKNGLLFEDERDWAKKLIADNHYSHCVPSGKSHYVFFDGAIVVWSIPANKNIAGFLFSQPVVCWELSRLWAEDFHAPNLLTQAISFGIKTLRTAEPSVEALVSYADPNAGHLGGVYKAASWVYHGQSEESRVYVRDGQSVARRAFHSGKKSLKKSEILALGYEEKKLPGKHRFVKCLTKRARRSLR